MQTKSLKQTLSEHNTRVRYNRNHTSTKVFIGGMMLGVLLGIFFYSVLLANILIK